MTVTNNEEKHIIQLKGEVNMGVNSGERPKGIILNGTSLKVKKIKFVESKITDEEYYHDCYITFLNGETGRYDASDVIVIE